MADRELTKKLIYQCRNEEIPEGVTFADNDLIIIYRDASGQIRAARNRCKHQGGRFAKSETCILTCPRHGWRLDASTFSYINPAEAGMRQDELVVESCEDGTIHFYELATARPWDEARRPRMVPSPFEFSVRFYAHACVEIMCGPLRLFTDPWLTGPAFTRGWWLTQTPPADWLERLSTADGIYISHGHSDHLNRHTLKLLVEKNPDAPIYIPQFENRLCEQMLTDLGFTSVRSVAFGTWMDFGVQGRFMILPDGAGRDDSGILVEYKGYRLLNTVDCSNLNSGILPDGVDVLMTNFAGGASGYPVCWGELYSEEEITRMVRKNREAQKVRINELVRAVKPKVYVPFAGFFTEAHPADAEIRRLNQKNSPEEICEHVKKGSPDVIMHIPEPGAVMDIRSGEFTPPEGKPGEPTWNFDLYTKEIADDLASFQNMSDVEHYFRTAGFTGDLVLHVMETTEDFSKTLREFMVDFSDLSFPALRPARAHRYLRMRVRADVFRHVLKHRLSWEEISIGFQARFFREPNAYNFDFWNHFQNKLLE